MMQYFLVEGCEKPSPDPVRYGPFCGELMRWVEVGTDASHFASALDGLERRCWSGLQTGWVDESLAVFNGNEILIANYLAAEGHNVVTLPTRKMPSTPSPDAIVSGMLVEFKTYFGGDAKVLTDKLVAARRQADRVVIHAPNLVSSIAVSRVTRAMALAGRRRGLSGIKIIGADFGWEWGEWNVRVCADHGVGAATAAVTA